MTLYYDFINHRLSICNVKKDCHIACFLVLHAGKQGKRYCVGMHEGRLAPVVPARRRCVAASVPQRPPSVAFHVAVPSATNMVWIPRSSSFSKAFARIALKRFRAYCPDRSPQDPGAAGPLEMLRLKYCVLVIVRDQECIDLHEIFREKHVVSP
jgi:hypothetical protein